MAAKILTQLGIDRLRAPSKGRKVHWDSLVVGFGLCVTARGARSWKVKYRVHGRQVLQTLGTLAAIPKVDDARRLAREAILAAKTGINPVEERRAEKAAEEAERVTFADIAARWMREHVERNCAASWARESRRILERDVLPRWGERPVRDVTRQDVNDLLDAK